MIRFDSVSKSYGDVQALRNLSLEIDRGEVFGYIGPNGAGKTTTIKILTGLIRDFRGTVLLDGNPIGSDATFHARVGYLPQDVGFQEWRTVDHALATFGLLSGIGKSELPAAVDRALDTAGITEHRSRRIVHLSGGTIQRLRLAQAILHDPEILVLDEPLSGLDPASRHQVREIIGNLAGRKRLVLFSSHILSEVEGIASRIGILHQGEIREVGTPAELRERYQVGTVVEIVARPGYAMDPAIFAQLADARPEQIEVNTLRLHLDASDLDAAMGRVLRILATAAVPVRLVRHVQPSLEDVYLSLTER